MTPEQSQALLTDYLTAFPGTREWIGKNSPDPSGTIAIWQGELIKLNHDDCRQAVSGMISGHIEPPKAYERDSTVRHIKAAAGRIADKRHRLAESQRNRELANPEGRETWPLSLGFQFAVALMVRAIKLHGRTEERDWWYEDNSLPAEVFRLEPETAAKAIRQKAAELDLDLTPQPIVRQA